MNSLESMDKFTKDNVKKIIIILLQVQNIELPRMSGHKVFSKNLNRFLVNFQLVIIFLEINYVLIIKLAEVITQTLVGIGIEPKINLILEPFTIIKKCRVVYFQLEILNHLM